MPKRSESRLREMLDMTERQIIEWAYDETQSLVKAAEVLGVSRAHIYIRVHELGLDHLVNSSPARNHAAKENARKRNQGRKSKKSKKKAQPAAKADASTAPEPEETPGSQQHTAGS